MSDLPLTSLPEGWLLDTLQAVDVSGVAFPDPCPAGQVTLHAAGVQRYCSRSQERGLEALYNLTGGTDAWLASNRAGWVDAAAGDADWRPCDGVPAGPSAWSGVACDGNGRVSGLSLVDNGLEGPLPAAALASLSSLTFLDLSNNGDLSGGLAGMETLVDLQSLRLFNNRHTGDLSPLRFMTSLVLLDLTNNLLTGGLAFASALRRMERLYLGVNDFTGTLDALEGCSRLMELQLHNNDLEGGVGVISSMPRLVTLYVAHNELVTTPGAFDHTGPLEEISMAFNEFTGSLDFLRRFNATLKQAYLNSNAFSGRIDAVANLAQLTALMVNHNNLEGDIGAVANLRDLVSLYLHDNSFSGSLAPIAGLSRMTLLRTESNAFTGGLDALGGLSKLRQVFLDGNAALTGTLDVLASLPAIELINARNTAISGVIRPSSFVSPSLNKIRITGSQVVAIAGHTPLPAAFTVL